MHELGRVHSFCDIFAGAESIFTEMSHSIHTGNHFQAFTSSHIESFVGCESRCFASSGFVMQLYFNDLGENFPQTNNNNNNTLTRL